ncbi:MAG: EMC3/TMCO1 family protein [Promethearchaeota archaeon]
MVGTIPAELPQYLIVLAICVGMTTVSQLFRHFFGMKPEKSMAMQQRLRELQTEMMAARNDPETLAQIQQEAAQTYKTTMRKQLIPSCVSSLLFLGIWWIVGGLFSEYFFFNMPTWTFYIPYLMFSLIINGGIFLVRYLIKRSKKKRGVLEDDDEFKAAMDRSMKSGLNFRPGWDANLSPELKQMKSDLQQKKDRGQIPQDIDIDAEIQQMSEDDDEKDWKKRLES